MFFSTKEAIENSKEYRKTVFKYDVISKKYYRVLEEKNLAKRFKKDAKKVKIIEID